VHDVTKFSHLGTRGVGQYVGDALLAALKKKLKIAVV
jgi:hypothetical protein